MMKKHLSVLCILIYLFAGKVMAQTFNTDAIRSFWHVVDEMEKDKPLTDSLWNSYFNLEGNKTYMLNNRPAEQVAEHRKYLELVFRPSLADAAAKLKPVQPVNGRIDDILKNLLFIKAHEKALRNYTTVVTAPGYLDACIALAKKYLPANKQDTINRDLVIYIQAITFDAAVQPPNMYFGLSVIYEFDRFQKGTIAAHELHHQLRKDRQIEKPVSYADSTSFSIISQVNNEGQADLVDKRIAVANKATLYDAADLVHWLLDDAEKTIVRLDSGLRVNAKGGAIRLSYRDFRKLTDYSSGHIPGFYMDQVIIRNGGFQQLTAHCDNPFNTFYLYNKAAQKDSAHPPMFSAETMAYLHRLEKQVFK